MDLIWMIINCNNIYPCSYIKNISPKHHNPPILVRYYIKVCDFYFFFYFFILIFFFFFFSELGYFSIIPKPLQFLFLFALLCPLLI
ncbi:hypothetical protein [Plasmodium yoelii yoelii]|uniref:Uncharacterized protein n=1 Tax=Plasmodium yoelii yoelii TaxID=73239 RepID=Q7RBN7_PLAYO|nr:hypothetical protein [Plasmodium yoelii yoelii]